MFGSLGADGIDMSSVTSHQKILHLAKFDRAFGAIFPAHLAVRTAL